MWLRVLVLGVLITQTAFSRPQTPVERRVRVASEVVTHRMLSERPIPQYIIDASLCAVSLKVVKAGLIWGGQGSAGLATCKVNGEWSAPSFFSIDGVTFGLQIGVQFLESVLLFMTPYGREVLQHPTFQLGVDVSFAAGPVGGGQGTGVIPEAHVLTYSRAVGLYAGATVNGFVLTHNPGFNASVYGEGVAPIEVLDTPGSSAPAVVSPFVETMQRQMPF
ncbi:MAG: lipid-binding SYLF domain-containing protein [Bdellovibrionales bacterium]|nr:lipid-binding SYLF domain-containing protein [Bdellovibrionales bacterium]